MSGPRPVRRWLRVALYALTLLGVSTIHLPKTPKNPWDQRDKAVHVTMYSVLGALLRAASGSTPGAIVAGSAFGAVDELYQKYISGRDGDVWDWLADTVGVSIGALLFARYERKRRRQTPSGTG